MKKYKKWIGIIFVMILLSFFSVTKENISVPIAAENSETEQYVTDRMAACVKRLSDPAAEITVGKKAVGGTLMRGQKMIHIFAIRYTAVVFILLNAVQMLYQITRRHFDCRRIALWENIFYIHQIDGKKEKSLLYTYQ